MKKPTRARPGYASGGMVMARNFLKNLDEGTLIDRTAPRKKKNKHKRIAAPSSLLKFIRPRPTATDNAVG